MAPLVTATYLANLITDFYKLPGNGVGGNPHLVTDDYNIETDHIDFCIQRAIDAEDGPAVVLGWLLRQATKTQRSKAVRIA